MDGRGSSSLLQKVYAGPAAAGEQDGNCWMLLPFQRRRRCKLLQSSRLASASLPLPLYDFSLLFAMNDIWEYSVQYTSRLQRRRLLLCWEKNPFFTRGDLLIIDERSVVIVF